MSAESSDDAADALTAEQARGGTAARPGARRPERGADRAERAAAPRRRPVVISSVTGEPIAWEDDEGDHGARRPDARDAEILRDVPPHWGTGA